jgi:hypothetical protein
MISQLLDCKTQKKRNLSRGSNPKPSPVPWRDRRATRYHCATEAVFDVEADPFCPSSSRDPSNQDVKLSMDSAQQSRRIQIFTVLPQSVAAGTEQISTPYCACYLTSSQCCGVS